LGRRVEAEEHFAQADAEAQRNRLPMATVNNLLLESALALASGRFADAERLTIEATRQTGRNSPPTQLMLGAQRLALQMEQGRVDDVIDTLRQLDKTPVTHGWTAMLAAALADLGRHDEASAALHELVYDSSSDRRNDFATPIIVRYLPEVCRHLGDSQAATALLPLVKAWTGQLLIVATGISIDGAGDRSLGHLLATRGRLDEADLAYSAATELERSADFPPLFARTAYWHARTLLERDAPGDNGRACRLLDEMIEITARIGMPLLHRQATALSARVAARHHGELSP
jgi:tetratricopeptide (TPR) repeat protein